MNMIRISILAFAVLAVSALSTQAAQLASAKVINVEGTVTQTDSSGQETQLKAGDILKEGDNIQTSRLGQAELVFSNGSELVLQGNSNLSISKLEQASFNGNQSYEELEADPSESQTLLDLKYGKLRANVKKLTASSSFNVETPLGTAAVRGTILTVEFRFDPVRNEIVFNVFNQNGQVDIITPSAPPTPVTPTSTETIRAQRGDPGFEQVLELIRGDLPQDVDADPPAPVITPEPSDPDTIIVSPEGPAS